MPANLHLTKCCGVKEINGLAQHKGDGPSILRDLLRPDNYSPAKPDYYNSHFCLIDPTKGNGNAPCGIVMFTDADIHENGIRFAAYVRKNNLGVITEVKAFNPNSLRHITAYMWVVDHTALTMWRNANYKPEPSPTAKLSL